MLLLNPFFYVPLTDDEYARVASSSENTELFIDFVTVLQGLVVSRSDHSYESSVFTDETIEETCSVIVSEFQGRDVAVAEKMQLNLDAARLLAKSTVDPNATTDVYALVTLANSFLEKLFNEYNRFREVDVTP